jgi:hypothetical protein
MTSLSKGPAVRTGDIECKLETVAPSDQNEKKEEWETTYVDCQVGHYGCTKKLSLVVQFGFELISSSIVKWAEFELG